MKRTLTLKRDSLSELTNDELATIRGGIPTFEGPICFVLNTSDARCHTEICIGTR
jgi:bacteriocin-like protein